jgi:SAM-dependent methyltransferase
VTDVLSPTPDSLLDAWRARVMADKEQVERSREEPDPTDFYAPVRDRFRMDPRRTDDATVNVLLALARPDDVWLDIGAGGGRYALPLALHVERVVAIDPSPSMLEALAEDAAGESITNVDVIESRWPMAGPPRGTVGLMAHVGYDIAEIGPFVEQLEAQSARLCVAVMGATAMQTTGTLYWNAVHGEDRIRLPALPEFVALLFARGRIPELSLVDRVPPTFSSFDEAMAMARRQLWVRAGSAKDSRLQAAARDTLTERDGRFAFEWTSTKIGIVSWSPR